MGILRGLEDGGHVLVGGDVLRDHVAMKARQIHQGTGQTQGVDHQDALRFALASTATSPPPALGHNSHFFDFKPQLFEVPNLGRLDLGTEKAAEKA